MLPQLVVDFYRYYVQGGGEELEGDVGDTCKPPNPLAEPPKANPNPPRWREKPKASYSCAYSK